MLTMLLVAVLLVLMLYYLRSRAGRRGRAEASRRDLAAQPGAGRAFLVARDGASTSSGRSSPS